MQITLKAARVNSGYTLDEAAEKIGVTRQTLSNWENKKTSPSLKQYSKCCDTYHCTIDDLIFLG